MKRRTYQIIVLTLIFVLAKSSTNAQKAELVVQTAHTRTVNSVAFSPDGNTLASGSSDETIKLWDINTGQELKTLSGHTSSGVSSIVFSPDGLTLTSGSGDGTIKLWDMQTGEEVKTLNAHTRTVNSVAFSPDGLTLASASWAIKLWDINSGQELRTLNGHTERVNSVAFSPDRKTLASASSDKTIKLWDINAGRELKTLNGHTSSVRSVAFSPDGLTLASGSSSNPLRPDVGNNTIKLWDINTGRELKTLRGHTSSVNSVAFSPDGKTIASGSSDETIKLWNITTGQERKTLKGHAFFVSSVAFSPDGKTLASGSDLPPGTGGNTIKLWDIDTGQELKSLKGHTRDISSVAFSPEEITIAWGSYDKTVKLWDLNSGQGLKTLKGHKNSVLEIAFSPDGLTLVSAGTDNTIKLWEINTGNDRKTLKGHTDSVISVAFSPDGLTLASCSFDNTIRLWDVKTGEELKTLQGHSDWVQSVAFSPDGKSLASGSDDGAIKLWDIKTGQELKTLKANTKKGSINSILSVTFSPDGKTLASGSWNRTVKLWDVGSGTELRTLEGHSDVVHSVTFSPDGKTLASEGRDDIIKLWEVVSGEQLRTFGKDKPAPLRGVFNIVPDLYRRSGKHPISADGRFQIKIGENGKLNLHEVKTGKLLASLIALNENNWVVTTPEGRFDTSKSLDRIEGLHWTINNEIFKPLPLDVFMRQYYEPGLLQRVLKCSEENNCDSEFKPLPPISEINRVQPKVAIKEIKPVTNVTDLIDVTIEVESVTEDVSISATDRTKKKKLTSGGFDLRLFRDEQLVGVSTPKERLEPFIKSAPDLIDKNREYFKKTGKLTNTPEDDAWRKANDIFSLGSSNVKRISPSKIEYTFRNIKLPKDGRKEVEFTAYAFNRDKVKSTTTPPFKFTIPTDIANSPKKGRAFVVSIGVNASENPAFNLRYAANDARKMQQIIGTRLKAESSKYSEVIQIPLISDYDKGGKLAENTAQKAVIKSVFSLLAGDKMEVSDDILAQIPNRDKIKPVEPEDTLIIAFSGHGYADQSGIFYLLPYDIGKSFSVKTKSLQKTISSDELSLWMQDITAAEMIMIIDACYSSSAVGADFKPGPMGSRGLGQLAYDKDMKILSATQANNVALELNSLEQGLLSYALLEDGIVKSLADSDKDKKLHPAEWLSYAEKRVPELYREVKDGKRSILLDGKKIDGAARTDKIILGGDKKSSLNLQQPSLFDFKRRKAKRTLFVLP